MTPASMQIKLASEKQIAEVCCIIREGYLPELLRGTIYESDRFDRYLVERHRGGDLFLLGIDPGRESIVGFAQVLQHEGALHVNHLVVRRDARGLGVGARLLEDVGSRARDQKQYVTLDVDSRNTEAVAFYRKAGFRVQNETPVARIDRKSGCMPRGLTEGSDDYRKYGFCYVDQQFSPSRTRVGIVGSKTIRLLVSNMASDFDWNDFSQWSQWADVFVFGAVSIDPGIDVQESWSVLRMRR